MKALALVLLFVASIAYAKSNSIDGQVFIVTGGHESVKLGLVTIAACRPDEFASAAASTKSQIDSERPKLDEIRPIADQMSTVASELKRAVMKADSRAFKSDGWSSLLTDSITMEMNTNRLSHRVAWRTDYVNSGAPYFKNLPHPIASVKTDADGKFKLELPSSRGQVIVVASATRYVPTKDRENYFWAVKVMPPATVTLSNDNVTDSGSSDSALQTLPLLTSPPVLVEGVLTEAPYEQDTADKLKDEMQKLKADADKMKHDLLVSTGTETPPPALAPIVMITLTAPVSIQTQSGTVTLPVGTQVQFVSQINNKLHVQYLNSDYYIPLSSTDLKSRLSRTGK
jgi:hypothetical protein